MDEREEDEEEREPQFGTFLAGLAVATALVALGLFIVDRLKATSELEDCAMSGRHNCAPFAIEAR